MQQLLYISWTENDTLDLGAISAIQHEFTELNYILISQEQLSPTVPEAMHVIINMQFINL